MRRNGTAADIAAAVLFFAQPRNSLPDRCWPWTAGWDCSSLIYFGCGSRLGCFRVLFCFDLESPW